MKRIICAVLSVIVCKSERVAPESNDHLQHKLSRRHRVISSFDISSGVNRKFGSHIKGNVRSSFTRNKHDQYNRAVIVDMVTSNYVPRSGGKGNVLNSSTNIKDREGKTVENIAGTTKRILQASKIVMLASLLGISIYYLKDLNIFDKDKFKSDLLETLKVVNESGPLGAILYVVVFAIYEAFGLPTAIVETVAGAAFGAAKGIVVNGLGKCGGAILAIILTRFFFLERVRTRFANNKIIQLVDQSAAAEPIRTVLLLRFTPLPELVKHLALAILPISLVHVIPAVILHLFPFTILWTLVGLEAAMKLSASVAGENFETSTVLKVAVLATLTFGAVGSPTILALWVKKLSKQFSAIP